MPVVINSGSGNQGMTVSLPVIVFADEWEVSHEKLCRSLVVSNLIAIHQKYYIGSLSAYCGAVSAACGAGAGITYMYGGTYQQVSLTIISSVYRTRAFFLVRVSSRMILKKQSKVWVISDVSVCVLPILKFSMS